jgi:PAS domain S-box-containing protein
MAGRSYYPGVSRSGKLDWYVVAGIPAGLENSRIRATVIYVAGGFVGSLLVGLLLAPLWSARLTQALTRIVGRADQITRGEVAGQWPRSLITEFNQISTDLEKMATGLQEREQKLQAVFNTAPVAMSLTDMDNHSVLIDVNEAWCRTFARRREEALGRSGVELGLWRSLEERDAAVQRSVTTGGMVETWAMRGDGVPILCQAFRRELRLEDANLMIWASVDITAVRRTEDALRDLNADLEARVASRTRQLEKLNTELSVAFENLRMTQGELVRSEKMAALGSLVAGVSHELNTPLGNGLMAVSALADAVRSFKGTMQSGLRRSDLEDFVLRVDQGADIAVRNLQRAADLVVSFKQVAVDQTSSQRRRFELSEVVHEMVISLGPTLRRTPYEVVLDVPKIGLLLDSYPGPLGQTLGNLINNAVMHAFDGRQNGTIRITGYRDVNGWIALRVEDNGQGIPAALLPRIFDPFVTTKMGRGGTGLGLHIAYNAVTTLLGGTLTVHSVQGQGTTFELHLPEQAPLAV